MAAETSAMDAAGVTSGGEPHVACEADGAGELVDDKVEQIVAPGGTIYVDGGQMATVA